MIVGVAFVPSAPLMFLDVDVEHLLDDLRDASIELIREFEPMARRVIIIGSDTTTHWYMNGGIGSSRGFGGIADYSIGSSAEVLPLSLAVGAAVLEAAAWDTDVIALSVASHSTYSERAKLAGEVVAQAVAVPTLLVVVGDGSATRTEKAPGYVQPDAIAFDAEIAEALGSADVDALVSVTQDRADRLWCQGLPAWQVAASAVPSAQGVLALQSAPFGVNYLVASWRP
ncbi:MAG: hypothetical protein WC005_03390 [Candidatus Nanopelagicales bacterium]